MFENIWLHVSLGIRVDKEVIRQYGDVGWISESRAEGVDLVF